MIEIICVLIGALLGQLHLLIPWAGKQETLIEIEKEATELALRFKGSKKKADEFHDEVVTSLEEFVGFRCLPERTQRLSIALWSCTVGLEIPAFQELGEGKGRASVFLLHDGQIKSKNEIWEIITKICKLEPDNVRYSEINFRGSKAIVFALGVDRDVLEAPYAEEKLQTVFMQLFACKRRMDARKRAGLPPT